jgi:hypothetical protein
VTPCATRPLSTWARAAHLAGGCAKGVVPSLGRPGLQERRPRGERWGQSVSLQGRALSNLTNAEEYFRGRRATADEGAPKAEGRRAMTDVPSAEPDGTARAAPVGGRGACRLLGPRQIRPHGGNRSASAIPLEPFAAFRRISPTRRGAAYGQCHPRGNGWRCRLRWPRPRLVRRTYSGRERPYTAPMGGQYSRTRGVH